MQLRGSGQPWPLAGLVLVPRLLAREPLVQDGAEMLRHLLTNPWDPRSPITFLPKCCPRFSPGLTLGGVGAAAELGLEERCPTISVPLVTEPPLLSHSSYSHSSMIPLQKGAFLRSRGWEGAGAPRDLAPLAGLGLPKELPQGLFASLGWVSEFQVEDPSAKLLASLNRHISRGFDRISV